MKVRRIGVYAGLLVLVVGAILGADALFVTFTPAAPLSNSSEVRDAAAFEVRRFGAERAYRTFMARHSDIRPESQHFFAHLFGEALYDVKGIDGVGVCDTKFEFGCAHGFFTRAVSDRGTDVIPELDARCVEKFGELGAGCQHGIGHGVLEYVGHEKLEEALTLCSATSQPAPLLGCTSGVYMEYFFPLSFDGQSAMLPFNSDAPYASCTALPVALQDSCYYELARWLPYAAPGFPACDSLFGSFREHCFAGLGTYIAYETYSPESVEKWCGEYGGDDETFCRAGAAWAFFSVPEHREKTRPACTFADADRTARCLAFADFTSGKDITFPKLP